MESDVLECSTKAGVARVRCDSEGGATYSGTNNEVSRMLELPLPTLLPQWYAVQTRPRHEKKVAAELARKGIENYVPLLGQIHRWSARSADPGGIGRARLRIGDDVWPVCAGQRPRDAR